MEDNNKKKRVRRISTWMSDASRAINNEDEIFAGKKIVLKILRYMEDRHMTQKELADLLGVTPQYINKFLHGYDCDIKISTAVRYGKILNLKLIEIPDDTLPMSVAPIVVYTLRDCEIKPAKQKPCVYDSISYQSYKCN